MVQIGDQDGVHAHTVPAGAPALIVRAQVGADLASGVNHVHIGVIVPAGATTPAFTQMSTAPVIAGVHAGHGDCRLLTA